jgi:hypothetical protein
MGTPHAGGAQRALGARAPEAGCSGSASTRYRQEPQQPPPLSPPPFTAPQRGAFAHERRAKVLPQLAHGSPAAADPVSTGTAAAPPPPPSRRLASARSLMSLRTPPRPAEMPRGRRTHRSSGASEEERTARALAAAATATRQAVDAGLSAARVEHAITHMRGIRPDIVANDTMNASARMLLEAKTAALCPSNYGTRFAANGDTWMEARARKALVERDMAAKKLDDVVFPNACSHRRWPRAAAEPGRGLCYCRWCFLRAQRPGPQSCEPPRCQGGARGRDGDWPRQQIRGGF